MRHARPTFAELAVLVSYDPQTGFLQWKQKRHPSQSKIRTDSHGYQAFYVGKSKCYVHRVAYLLMTGEWPKEQIDHANLCRSDNRWENLRSASPLQNQANKTASCKSASKVKGVDWVESRKKWRAQIRRDGRKITLGYFDDLSAASAAYMDAATAAFGQFARGTLPRETISATEEGAASALRNCISTAQKCFSPPRG